MSKIKVYAYEQLLDAQLRLKQLKKLKKQGEVFYLVKIHELLGEKLDPELSRKEGFKIAKEILEARVAEARKALEALESRRPTRAWINQPSTLQPFHTLHGTNVLTIPENDDPRHHRIYFLSGGVVSQRIAKEALSPGWVNSVPEENEYTELPGVAVLELEAVRVSELKPGDVIRVQGGDMRIESLRPVGQYGNVKVEVTILGNGVVTEFMVHQDDVKERGLPCG